MTDLLTPINLGDLQLPNRIIMAPLTRSRAEAGHVPGDMMAEYYAQRASAGLLIAEATMAMENVRRLLMSRGFTAPSKLLAGKKSLMPYMLKVAVLCCRSGTVVAPVIRT